MLAVNWKSIHFCGCVLYFWPKALPLSPNSWKLFPDCTISHTNTHTRTHTHTHAHAHAHAHTLTHTHTHTHIYCHWHWSSVWSSKKYIIYLMLKSLFLLSVNDKLSDSDFISSCQDVKSLFLLDYNFAFTLPPGCFAHSLAFACSHACEWAAVSGVFNPLRYNQTCRHQWKIYYLIDQFKWAGHIF